MNKEIKISFPEKKEEALRYFLQKKNASLETELAASLSRLYDRHVPPTVRDYLDEVEKALD